MAVPVAATACTATSGQMPAGSTPQRPTAKATARPANWANKALKVGAVVSVTNRVRMEKLSRIKILESECSPHIVALSVVVPLLARG